jgi:hypothetical protein
VSLRPLYLIFVRLCGWLVLPGRSDDEQRSDAVQAELNGASAGQATQCCGGLQAATGTEDEAAGVCCG